MNKLSWLVLTLVALPLSLFAPEKPDYSGVWEVNSQKSQLANWARFDSTTITIEHQEPNFSFRRVSVKGAKTDETSYELTTDGAEKIEKEDGNTRTSSLSWEGDELVYRSRLVLSDGREVLDTVRYSLRDGGRTFVAEEKFRGPVLKYDNLWVADRKSESPPAVVDLFAPREDDLGSRVHPSPAS